jgi:hypothetical protein
MLTVKIKDQWKINVGRIVLIQRIKKPKDRSCKDAEAYGLPISTIKPQQVEYGLNKAHYILLTLVLATTLFLIGSFCSLK